MEKQNKQGYGEYEVLGVKGGQGRRPEELIDTVRIFAWLAVIGGMVALVRALF